MTPMSARSKKWYGRRFRLDANLISWGRFYVADLNYLESNGEAKNELRKRFQQANPQVIADAFENLLCLQKPEVLSSFYAEMEALSIYEFTRESLAMMTSPINRMVYENLLGSLAQTFKKALITVFESAQPLQNKPAKLVEYQPNLANPYSAVFCTHDEVFDAIFDSELVLKCVRKRSAPQHIWPPLHIGATKSVLISSLLTY